PDSSLGTVVDFAPEVAPESTHEVPSKSISKTCLEALPESVPKASLESASKTSLDVSPKAVPEPVSEATIQPALVDVPNKFSETSIEDDPENALVVLPEVTMKTSLEPASETFPELQISPEPVPSQPSVEPQVSEALIAPITAVSDPPVELETVKGIPEHVPYLIIGAGTSSVAAFRAIKARDAKAKVSSISYE
ncbi:unnamed protein product, partial [Meganyctiphanes norvegica]